MPAPLAPGAPRAKKRRKGGARTPVPPELVELVRGRRVAARELELAQAAEREDFVAGLDELELGAVEHHVGESAQQWVERAANDSSGA